MTNATLITNANIFDGENEQLSEGMSVLVEGNKITAIAKSASNPGGAAVIDAGGRGMTPGFIATLEHLVGQMHPGRRVSKSSSWRISHN